MKLIDVRWAEDGINEADGNIGSTYTYYEVSLQFEEFPNMWFKYDKGDGMMTFDKARETVQKLEGMKGKII